MKTLRHLLAVGFLLAVPSLALADSIDGILAQNGYGLIERLQAGKWANVGVLKGQIQTGGANGPITTGRSRMGELLATRLENVLILGLDPNKPIGITQSASSVAQKRNPDATYNTPEGRAALIEGTYPLAWGKTLTKVDVFLVPRLTLDEKLQNVTLSLRYFTAVDPKTWLEIPLQAAQAPVTRQMLIDLDQPFILPGSIFRKRGAEGDLRDEFPADLDRAIQPIKVQAQASGGSKQPEKQPPVPKPAQPEATPDSEWVNKALSFNIYYDDKLIEPISPYRFPEPKPGQKVHFTIQSQERLGVVVLVNGINTADYDRASKESSGYVKWVLEPKEAYLIRGYYTETKVYPFQVASKSLAKELLSGLADSDRYGLIELHIYKEVSGGVVEARSGPVLRAETADSKSLAELQMQIKVEAARGSKPVKKAFLVPGSGEDKTLESTNFEGVLAAKLQFRYSD